MPLRSVVIVPRTSIAIDRRLDAFSHIDDEQVYLDSACQSPRPAAVLDALDDYYTASNACGGRVKYAWGRTVDDGVANTRAAVLRDLKLSASKYAVSFTLNTTMGINLLLQQLPIGRYARVITSHVEHNSVYLPTITAARRLGVPRTVLERASDGSLEFDGVDLDRAVVVVSAMSNIDGSILTNARELVRAVHAAGGIVILDAAQAMAHTVDAVAGLDADAICYSAHKTYGASLGVVVARMSLLRQLEVSFIGGGMVADVGDDDFELVSDDPGSVLEPGLQAWAEILALGAALPWRARAMREGGVELHRLSTRLHEGLAELPGLQLLNSRPSTVISVVPRQDAHRLAIFLSQAEVMVRSGYFCAHHELKHRRGLPPLLRFSLGLHTTQSDVDRALDVLGRLLRGLR